MGASKKMAKMEKLQKKKKKKILESEEIEFDHFCRASRKYLISSVYLGKDGQIEKCNNSNVKQQRFLYKVQKKERKQRHFVNVDIRDRLREIKEKHIAQFEKIIQREQQQQQKQKNKEKQQQQQKAQQSKPKPKPKPTVSPPPPQKQQESKPKPKAKAQIKEA